MHADAQSQRPQMDQKLKRAQVVPTRVWVWGTFTGGEEVGGISFGVCPPDHRPSQGVYTPRKTRRPPPLPGRQT